MHEMKRRLSVIILSGLALAGCNKTPTTVDVTGINLNKEELELIAGETFQLVASVVPENATETKLVFSSNNRSVANVDESGLISALSPGEATVTVSSVTGGAYKNCAVTVKSQIRNLGEKETANCYIVSEGGLVGFKPYKGNSQTLVGNVASASVLWETVNTAIAPAPGTLITEPQYKDGMVAFRVPDNPVEGSALIAALDAAGNILWSWHIWVVKGSITEITMANNAGILMDRNLGAIGTTPGDPRINGMMYQWGRKDPFMGIVGYEKPYERYAASAEMEANAGPEQMTIAWATAHPTAWGLRDEKNCDWLPSGDYTTEILRWGANASPKTIYDPCPPGWQIPGNSGIWSTAGITTNFSGEIVFDGDRHGCRIGAPYCTPDSWWPANGQLANDYIRSIPEYVPGVYGGWWTGASTNMGGGNNNAGRDLKLFLATSTLHMDNDYKQFGAAVRCLKITEQ